MEIKNLSLTKYKNDILFLPLGGSNEIGLNKETPIEKT